MLRRSPDNANVLSSAYEVNDPAQCAVQADERADAHGGGDARLIDRADSDKPKKARERLAQARESEGQGEGNS
jgi:hypothetical protein